MTSQKFVDNGLLEALEMLVFRTVHKVMNTPKFTRQFLNAVTNNPKAVAPVVALVRSEQQKLVIEQAKIVDRFQEFVEAGKRWTPTQSWHCRKGAIDPWPISQATWETHKRTRLNNHNLVPGMTGMMQDRDMPCSKNDLQDVQKQVGFSEHVVHRSDVPSVTVIKPVNELFPNADYYQNYRLIRKSAWYDNDESNELNKMKRKTAVQMKDQILKRKDPVSIISFLQIFKAECYARTIHRGDTMLLCKHYLSGPVENVIKARVELPTMTAKKQKGSLTSYSEISSYLL